MTSEILIPIIIGVIALALLLISLRLSYHLGCESNARFIESRFERLNARIQLDNTEWTVEFTDVDELGNDRKVKGYIRFRQKGPRIVGTGEDEHGRIWSAEGITYENKLAYLYSDRKSAGVVVGSVQVELSEDRTELNGLRSIWLSNHNSLLMQPIKLIHVDSGTDFAEECDPSDGASVLRSGIESSENASNHNVSVHV